MNFHGMCRNLFENANANLFENANANEEINEKDAAELGDSIRQDVMEKIANAKEKIMQKVEKYTTDLTGDIMQNVMEETEKMLDEYLG